MIESADMAFAGVLPPSRLAEASLLRIFWPHRPNLTVPTAVAVGVSVPAFVNGGRWVVQCPTCRSAQLAARSDPRFYCGECSNKSFGGMWVSVAWPADPTAIETALEARPVPNMNWLPGEAVTALLAENTAHGVAVTTPEVA